MPLPVTDQPNSIQSPNINAGALNQPLPEPPKPQIIHTATIGNLSAIGGPSLQLQPPVQQQIIHPPPTIVAPQPQTQPQPSPQPQPQLQPQPQVQMQPAPPPRRGLSLTVSIANLYYSCNCQLKLYFLALCIGRQFLCNIHSLTVMLLH